MRRTPWLESTLAVLVPLVLLVTSCAGDRSSRAAEVRWRNADAGGAGSTLDTQRATAGDRAPSSAGAGATPAATSRTATPIYEAPVGDARTWAPAPASVATWSPAARDGGSSGGMVGAPPRRPSGPSLASRLSTTRIQSLTIEDEESLRATVEPLLAMTGLPIVVTPRAEDAMLAEGVVIDLKLSRPITVKNVLNLICDLAGDEVAWTIRHGVVLVTTRDQVLAEGIVLASYDLRAMTVPIRDFPGPELRLRVSDDPGDPEEAFGGVGEARSGMEAEDILELVQEHVAPDTWGQGGTSIGVGQGILWVRHTPAVHAEVRRFLRRLGM